LGPANHAASLAVSQVAPTEVMSRIAAPMVGGMISSTVLTLGVIPAIYAG
jgi:Cu/Ag efflux pump CusA